MQQSAVSEAPEYACLCMRYKAHSKSDSAGMVRSRRVRVGVSSASGTLPMGVAEEKNEGFLREKHELQCSTAACNSGPVYLLGIFVPAVLLVISAFA